MRKIFYTHKQLSPIFKIAYAFTVSEEGISIEDSTKIIANLSIAFFNKDYMNN